MLEALRLLVDLVPGVAQGLDQVHREKPVVPDHLDGDSFAPLGQLGAPIAVMADEAECGQLAEHLAHGRGGNMEVLGQF